jgi:hypothetical protein
MEAIYSSEESVDFLLTTRLYIPEPPASEPQTYIVFRMGASRISAAIQTALTQGFRGFPAFFYTVSNSLLAVAPQCNVTQSQPLTASLNKQEINEIGTAQSA